MTRSEALFVDSECSPHERFGLNHTIRIIQQLSKRTKVHCDGWVQNPKGLFADCQRAADEWFGLPHPIRFHE